MAKRRDICLAEVFFSDSPESKIRPCIILSSDGYHKSGYVAAAAITTAADEYCLPIQQKDCNCILDKNSAARFDCIIRINQKHLIRQIGRVSPEFYASLSEKIIGTITQK